SRYGLVAYASSLDHIGVLGRTVDDAAAVLQVIAGHDPLDSTSAGRPVPSFDAEVTGSLEGLVIGVPAEYFPHNLHPGVAAACRGACRRLEALGAELREVSLPATPHAIPTYYILAPAEASS